MKDFKYSKEEIVEKTIGKLQEGEKTFSDLPQNIVVTESQFERLMEQCLGAPDGGAFANLSGMAIQPDGGQEDEEVVDDTIVLSLEEEDELDEIVNEAYSLINEAIKTERITLLEQGMYDRNPGVAAGEGIENIINHVKKAWEYIKDPTTRQKLENSIVKLSNFMTKTAELMAAGRDMRAPRADSSILKDMPYPEHEEGYEEEFTDEEEITETMVDDGSDEEMEEGYEDIDHSDRSKFDDRTSRVVGVDSNIEDQRMEESVQKELKLMTETWQTVVGNTLGTALGTALATKASEKMGLGEDDEGPEAEEGEMVPGEFEVTEDETLATGDEQIQSLESDLGEFDDKVLGTGISDDEGEGMVSGSPEDEASLERAVDSGEYFEADNPAEDEGVGENEGEGLPGKGMDDGETTN